MKATCVGCFEPFEKYADDFSVYGPCCGGDDESGDDAAGWMSPVVMWAAHGHDINPSNPEDRAIFRQRVERATQGTTVRHIRRAGGIVTGSRADAVRKVADKAIVGAIRQEGPYFHPKGCDCGHESICDGRGTMPIYLMVTRPT